MGHGQQAVESEWMEVAKLVLLKMPFSFRGTSTLSIAI